MKNERIRTSFNYVQEVGEINTLPSETVPDMTMSIREIFQRFAQGRPLVKSTNLHYTGDEFTPDVKRLDITEVEALKEANAERINSLSEDLKKHQKKQKKQLKKPEEEDTSSTTDDTKE